MNLPDKVNILLVDDQQAKLLSHEVVLAEIGENLFKATSAREAFECLLRNEIALILIDVCMPDLDGFELAAMIREHPRFQNTAIIFVSAVMLAHLDQLRGYKMGAVDYVPVPIVPELLRAKVKVFLDLYRKTRQLEQFNAQLERRVEERTAELRKFNEELEHRIEERTRERETALAQLFEAQKMDTIGRLTGGVAHDFNNLLMAVLGSLSLLEKRLPDDPQSRPAFAKRHSRGRSRKVPDPAVAGVFSTSGTQAPGRGLRSTREWNGRAAAARLGARESICEASFRRGCRPYWWMPISSSWPLLNVALNARDAMPEGGTLRILAQPQTTSAPGPGTPRCRRANMCGSVSWIPAWVWTAPRLPRRPSRFLPPRAWGRARAWVCPWSMGWRFSREGCCRSGANPMSGRRSNLWLPRASTSPITLSRPIQRQEPKPVDTPCTVLIVDDDLLVMTGTAAMVEDLGHRPVEAQSGAEALALLDSGLKVDVVLTDHSMPSMTGLQLAESIRGRFPGLPIILATGFAELPVDPRTKDIQRLAKPCTQHEIAAAIHSALSVAARI